MLPPNYAPGVASSIVTIHDAIESALVAAGVRAHTAGDGLRARRLPIFRRMSDLQWVNEGFFLRYGFGAPRDWTDDDWRVRLADHSEQNAAVRKASSRCSAIQLSSRSQPDAEPQLYGDKAELPPDAIEPRQWLTLTPLQYRHLKAWSEGRFTLPDDGPIHSPARLEDYRP